jgi:PAS domain-containing protein
VVDGWSCLYQQIVESAHEGNWFQDMDGQTTYANPQMAEPIGY